MPENNVSDNALQAWHDSITSSDDSDSVHSVDMIVINVPDVPQPHDDVITISVEVHNQGLRFGLSAQGDMLMSLLLNNPVPRQQLNMALFSALRPLVAAFGPWASGLGFRQEFVQVDLHVTLSEGCIQFSQARVTASSVQTSLTTINAALPLPEPYVRVEELTNPSEEHPNALLTLPAPPESAVSVPTMPDLSMSDEASLVLPTETSPDEAPLLMPDEGSSSMPATETTLKQHKGKMLAPVDTATLRRSNRTNKYDGFQVSATSAPRLVTSKVTPRVVRAALPSSEEANSAATTPTVPNTDDALPDVPPPTPIATLQAIGTDLCAVPAEELTASALSKE